ncbi:MAG: class I mannose-6-phosphate isomerase [Clostridia bacterium]|nr:class I mannose-6-phosphate isomerase [Clostridia bacterium]
MQIYPLKLCAVLKDAIWGGNKLSGKYGFGSPGKNISEAWTLALGNDGISIIENGEAAGMSLFEYAGIVGMDKLCGEKYAGKNPFEFPLLVKLIDARDALSIQVHPDNEYALSHSMTSGKSEMWYVIDAEPGAEIVLGLSAGTDINSPEFKTALYNDNGNITKYLNYTKTKKGDIWYIPAGMVHSIGKGVLVAEVQQNCNITYRIYDYGRNGIDGNPRELHFNKAMEVIKTDFSTDHSIGGGLLPDITGMPVKVIESKYFSVSKLILSGESFNFGNMPMTHILCLDGEGRLEYTDKNGNKIALDISASESILVPESFGGFTLCSYTEAEFLLSSI